MWRSSAAAWSSILLITAMACRSHDHADVAEDSSTGHDGAATTATGTEASDDDTSASSSSGDGASGEGAGSDGGSDDGTPVFDGCTELGAAHELLALGHAAAPRIVAVTADRVLADEDEGRWILWDVTGAGIVARGVGTVVGHGGDGFMVAPRDAGANSGFELRSLDDGAMQAAIDTSDADGGIAEDGSYAWTHGPHTLSLWNVDGSLRATVDGIDAVEHALALADVWLGPDDDGAMHRVDPSTGAVELDAFVGAFRGYFADRELYVTSGVNLVAIYPIAGGDAVAVHDLPAGTTLGGASGWLWRWWSGGSLLDVFDLHDTTAPVLSLSQVGASNLLVAGPVLALTDRGDASLTLVELGDEVPVARSIPAPRQRFTSLAAGDGAMAVAAERGGLWSLQGDTFAPLGTGQLLSLSGAADGQVAAAFELGGVQVLTVADGSVVAAIAGTVSKVVMRSDGLAVAALADTDLDGGAAVRVFGLPGGELAHALAGDDVADFDLSRDGGHLVRMRVDAPRHVELTRLADDTVIYDATAIDDERLALAPGGAAMTRSTAEPVTRFIVDGELVGAVDGRALGFVDDERLVFDAGGATLELRTPSGSWIASTPIPADVAGVLPVGDGRVYGIGAHRIYDLDAGVERPWTDAPPNTTDVAAVAGDFVVHTTCDGTRLVATPHR